MRSAGGSASRATRSCCAQVLVLGLRVGPALARRRLQLARVDVARDRLPLLADAAVVIDAQVAADADDPGLEVGAAIERVQRLEDLQEDVLREIFGFVVLADELVGDVEDLAPVLADDLLPGDLIAGQAALRSGVDASSAARPTGSSRHERIMMSYTFYLPTCGRILWTPAQTLDCDGVPLAAIAAADGTPLYVYSAAAIASVIAPSTPRSAAIRTRCTTR